MQKLISVISFLLFGFICNQFRIKKRLGFYRRQEVASKESSIPKVWEEIMKHFLPDFEFIKIGTYTKLVIGMEYQCFFIIKKSNFHDIQLFQAQVFKNENDLTNKKKINFESINQLVLQSQMSIHCFKYQMINQTIRERARKNKSNYRFIISVEQYSSSFDSIKIFYYDILAIFFENSQSVTKRFIIEEEDQTFRFIIELTQ